jgi:membrane-associated phospholipid phosphatase
MSFSPPRAPRRGRILQKRTRATLVLALLILGTAGSALAQTATPAPAGDSTISTVPEPPPPPVTPPPDVTSTPRGFGHDFTQYFTAPLHWNTSDWAWFGGALVAIGASHHYDTDVRNHFTKNLTPTEISNIKSNDVQDALPAAVVFLGTWAYSAWVDDPNGHREAWSMFEAAVLSSLTSYGTKFIVRREGPDHTSNPNEWFKSGGNSFPSEHATASFAIGTVLAEAGGDDYRWLRRVLGYGLGVGTSYLRLKHNAHWLSDTVAGGALGIASAQFTLNHAYRNQDSHFALIPVEGGAMLTYRRELP